MRLLISIFLFCLTLTVTNTSYADSKKTDNRLAEEIIMRGTLRCGYIDWYPLTLHDPKTNAYTGLVYEITQELAKALDLKLSMQEPLNLATYLQDLNNGRYDMECSGGWPNANRGKYVEYSRPYGYFAIVAVTRKDDMRMKSGTEWMNDKTVKIVTIDGESSALIKQRRFSSAVNVGLPSSSGASDMLMNVATGKADVAFVDMPSFMTFDKSNPGKLTAMTGSPIRLVPLVYSIPAGEYRLQQMVNTALDELLLDGVIDQIFKKYDPDGTMIKRVR
jgi:ABC-type amino acid transport substrate-binding protein